MKIRQRKKRHSSLPDLKSINKVKSKPSVRDAIADLPSIQTGGGGTDCSEYNNYECLTEYQINSRNGSRQLYNHWCSINSAQVIDTIKSIPPGGNLRKSWSQLPERIKVLSHSNCLMRLPKLI